MERETLHVYEGERRIALIETLTRKVGEEMARRCTESRCRGCACSWTTTSGSAGVEVELSAGKVIGYEEYFAYGATSFRMSSTLTAEVSARRYRYIGKERDEETGLSYHSARYYAAWLGRWTTSDPAGLVDGPGTYSYCRGSPIGNTDRNGREKKNSWAVGHGVLANTLDRLDAASTNKNNGMMKRLAAATGRLLIALPAAGEEFFGRPLANVPHNIRRSFQLFREAGHAFLAAYKLQNEGDRLDPQAYSERLSRIKASLAQALYGVEKMKGADSYFGEAATAAASLAPLGRVIGGLIKQTGKLIGPLARRLKAKAAARLKRFIQRRKTSSGKGSSKGSADAKGQTGKSPNAVAAPFFTDGGTDYLARYAPIVPRHSNGAYNVVFHATPTEALVFRGGEYVSLSHRSLAKYIRQLPDYNGGPIRLIACNTGLLRNGFAQNLANKMNVRVFGSTTAVEVTSLGNFWPKGTGQFSTFLPGGGF